MNRTYHIACYVNTQFVNGKTMTILKAQKDLDDAIALAMNTLREGHSMNTDRYPMNSEAIVFHTEFGEDIIDFTMTINGKYEEVEYMQEEPKGEYVWTDDMWP